MAAIWSDLHLLMRPNSRRQEPIQATQRFAKAAPGRKKLGKGKVDRDLVPPEVKGPRQQPPRATNTGVTSWSRGQELVNRLTALGQLSDKWKVCPKPIFFKCAKSKVRWGKWEDPNPYMFEASGEKFFKGAGNIKAGWFLCENAKRSAGVQRTVRHAWVGLVCRDPSTAEVDLYIWDSDADQFWDLTRSGPKRDGPIGKMYLSNLVRQQQTFGGWFKGYSGKNVRNIYYGGFGNEDGAMQCLPLSRNFLARVGERVKRGFSLNSPDFLKSEQLYVLTGRKD